MRTLVIGNVQILAKTFSLGNVALYWEARTQDEKWLTVKYVGHLHNQGVFTV